MNTISINSDIYLGAAEYANRHKTSVQEMVEDFLKKFQNVQAGTDENKCAINKDVLIAAAEYAISEYDSGNGFVNDDLESVIANRRGWK